MSDLTEQADQEASAEAQSYPATVAQLKEELDQFDDGQPIVGHTTDGDGNYFLYPVDVVEMPGNNERVLIDLTPAKVAE